MTDENRQSWWESLRHIGLLLSPGEVKRLETDRPLEPMRWHALTRLRRELNRFEAGETEPGPFAAYVLDQVCGFGDAAVGVWYRGSDVPTEFSHRLVTGEVGRPRHVWVGKCGGILPVFFDSSRAVGMGRGRKAISDVVQWLRRANLHLALVTNGKQWRLVFAGIDFDAACEWDVNLWLEEGAEGAQLEALRRMLHPETIDPDEADEDGRLLAAIRASRRGQAELSSSLGERVREAVEILVRAHGEALKVESLAGSEAEIYRAAVRVVMRMVVILFAESRDLLPRVNPIYHDAYGLQGLFESLQRMVARGRGRLNQRFGAWPRILALFRLIHDGSHHEAIQVPRYGGDLFEPGDPESADAMSRAIHVFETACFDSAGQPITDFGVYEMLTRLTRTRVRIAQGRSGGTWTTVPVNFDDLSSEYIGILYEGLLDYELRTAPEDEPIVFLAVGDEPALPLGRLEAMEDKQLKDLFATLRKSSDSSEEDEEALEEEDPDSQAELEADEEGEEAAEDEEEVQDDSPVELARQRARAWAERAVVAAEMVKKPRGRMTPEKEMAYQAAVTSGAKQLLKRDPIVPGDWYLVRWGGTRKGRGTFYTRPQLAVPTVHRTLRPLAYEVQEGKPAEKDAPRKPEDILDLKVCDPACGSGSFLVASLRYLTEAVYAALHAHDRLDGDAWREPLDGLLGLGATPDAQLEVTRLPCPPDAEDFEPRAKAILRRYVVERCIYGVDLDPVAVELCKLSLWIETMDRDLPFSFLDHKVKVGNALVGAWFDEFRHYPVMAWKNREGGDKSHSNGMHFAKDARTKAIKAFTKEIQSEMADVLRGQIRIGEEAQVNAERVHDEALETLARLHAMPVQDAEEKGRRYRDLVESDTWKGLKRALDLWCACWFWPGDDLEHAPRPRTFSVADVETGVAAGEVAAGKRFFHWELEFPDVYSEAGSGFDAVVGNPPWDIAKPNSKEYFSNIDPLFRSYGKQEAIRRQTDYFEAEAIEDAWVGYNADFRAQSNYVKHAYNPWGDVEAAEKPPERFTLARGKANAELHALWRLSRGRASGYADPAHPYRHQGSGDINLYKLFLERAHSLLADGGRMGFLVPSGIYSDFGTGNLRELFINESRWEWLFGFENREGIFDIHRSFKFNPLIVQKGEETEEIKTAFMRRKLEDWENAEDHATPYRRERVQQFSPRSRAILEIQSSRDLEILEKIYANSVLLGDDGPDGWGVKYATEFHMTNDSRLFPLRPQWEAKGYQPDEYSRWLKGKWRKREKGCPAPPGVKRVEIPAGIILSRDETEWIAEDEIEDVALPLYEGRMIGSYDFSEKGWVSGTGRSAEWREIEWSRKQIEPQFLMSQSAQLSTKDRDGNRKSTSELKCGFLAIGSSTNARSMVAGPVNGAPCGNSVPPLIPKDATDSLCLLSVLNSLAYDYALRNRLAGLNLNYFVISETPLPQLSQELWDIVRQNALSLLMPNTMFATHWKTSESKEASWRELWAVTRCERRRRIAINEAIMFAAFGLTWDDVRQILANCDLPRSVLDAGGIRQLNPKGFWRVDKDLDPENRLPVLSLLSFYSLDQLMKEHQCDIAEAARHLVGLEDGDGWQVPESIRLADYDLGHDKRARERQPVRLGKRHYAWQQEDPVLSWRECDLHSQNLNGAEASVLAEHVSSGATGDRDSAVSGQGEMFGRDLGV